MDCKKFNITAKTHSETPKRDIPAQKIISSVSTIEIQTPVSGNNQHSSGQNSARNRLHIAVFCGVCCLTILLCSVLPMPQTIKNTLVTLTELITEPTNCEAHNTVKSQKNKDADKIILPAASDSEITDIFEKHQEQAENTDSYDFSAANMTLVSNETSYSIIVEELLSQKYPIDKISKVLKQDSDSVTVFAQDALPTVLIIHTHGTEGYEDSASNYYRTTDKSRNVVAAGKLLSEKLSEHGIYAIHCETMFDENSYIKAYSNSYSAVSEYLSEYPSIKYVIDLHRDAIPDSDGSGYAKLTSVIGGKNCAQLMLVVGTNEAGAKHPLWKTNLRTAFEIQKNMCNVYPTLMRSINLRRASFNQQLCPGYFILEAGNCENSLSEVFSSIELFAKIFAETISE